jgi:hypothetical protein
MGAGGLDVIGVVCGVGVGVVAGWWVDGDI